MMGAYVNLIVLVVAGVFMVIFGIWQVHLVERNETLEAMLRRNVPAAYQILEESPDYFISRYDGKDVSVNLKVKRTGYRAEVVGKGATFIEAVEAARAEASR